MASFRRKQNVNIGRVVAKIVVTVIALYAGGVIMTSLGAVMNGTSSPFYQGLTLIGWTVGNPITNGTAGYYCTCAQPAVCTAASTTASTSQCITSVSGTGILAVIGVLGIAAVVMEFVEFRM